MNRCWTETSFARHSNQSFDVSRGDLSPQNQPGLSQIFMYSLFFYV